MNKKAALAVSSAKSPGKVLKKSRVHLQTPEAKDGGSAGSARDGEDAKRDEKDAKAVPTDLMNAFNREDTLTE